MRQAINNLHSTHAGFKFVNAENVFQVCDQPHPILVQAIINTSMNGSIDLALNHLYQLWKCGYSPVDIITTIFKVVKGMDMPEFLKLEYLKEIGTSHVKLLQGSQTLLQLNGLVCRLCQINMDPNLFEY